SRPEPAPRTEPLHEALALEGTDEPRRGALRQPRADRELADRRRLGRLHDAYEQLRRALDGLGASLCGHAAHIVEQPFHICQTDTRYGRSMLIREATDDDAEAVARLLLEADDTRVISAEGVLHRRRTRPERGRMIDPVAEVDGDVVAAGA